MCLSLMGGGFARRGAAHLPAGKQRSARPLRRSAHGGTVREEPRGPHSAAGRLHGTPVRPQLQHCLSQVLCANARLGHCHYNSFFKKE